MGHQSKGLIFGLGFALGLVDGASHLLQALGERQVFKAISDVLLDDQKFEAVTRCIGITGEQFQQLPGKF